MNLSLYFFFKFKVKVHLSWNYSIAEIEQHYTNHIQNGQLSIKNCIYSCKRGLLENTQGHSHHFIHSSSLSGPLFQEAWAGYISCLRKVVYNWSIRMAVYTHLGLMRDLKLGIQVFEGLGWDRDCFYMLWSGSSRFPSSRRNGEGNSKSLDIIIVNCLTGFFDGWFENSHWALLQHFVEQAKCFTCTGSGILATTL